MKIQRLPILLLWGMLSGHYSLAQNAFNNASQFAGSTDNTGNATFQPGTEVLNSTPGLGVMFENGGSFEHVGQFYVAANGIWNHPDHKGQPTIGTDYFGYAPSDAGASLPYLGKGIKGASANNGGKGTGRPTFGRLQLNSTGEFPVEGGMYIIHSLSFNANGPGKSTLITTPNTGSPDSPLNAVVFSPGATISGMDNQNYIDGYASVTGVTRPFTLPLGDPSDYPTSFCPLTINTATMGTVTARYIQPVQHPTTALGTGIGSVSAIGNWSISAPPGTTITVSLPALELTPSDAATLRLVGWNGSHWVDLSGASTAGSCGTAGCPLTGTISASIRTVGIGSTSRSLFRNGEESATSLRIWPNPTQGPLNVAVSSGKNIGQLRALDLQGRPVLSHSTEVNSLDTSALPSGTYLLEVITTQGQTLRQHFVKQP